MKAIQLFTIAAMTAAITACGQRKDDEKAAPAPPRQTVRMEIPSGTKAPKTVPVDTIPGQTRIKITCACLATADPAMLDVMPRDIKEARKDTALLNRINDREVYVVQPGETAYILAKEGNRLQLRFPDKIAWVMASNTK